MDNQIKLAEAMDDAIVWRNGIPFRHGSIVEFDPENDANDDYAVLEWFRNEYMTTSWHWMKFREALYLLNHETDSGYLIGNYARAALKVIEC